MTTWTIATLIVLLICGAVAAFDSARRWWLKRRYRQMVVARLDRELRLDLERLRERSARGIA